MSLPLLPGRTCGGCVECCRVIPLDLPELAKPTGELCAYCVDGAGCSVHEIRPNTSGKLASSKSGSSRTVSSTAMAMASA